MNNSATEHDTTRLITSFHSELTVHSNDISISYCKKLHKLVKIPLLLTWRFIKILPFWQRAQNTKQHISVDSPSCAEQNSTNDFVMACMVVEILCSVEPLKDGFWSNFDVI